MKKLKKNKLAASKVVLTAIEEAIRDYNGPQTRARTTAAATTTTTAAAATEAATTKAAAVTTKAATFQKTNRPPNPESSDVILFTSLTEVKPMPKKILRERMSKIGKPRYKRMHPNDSKLELLPSNMSRIKTQYYLRTRRHQPMTKENKSFPKPSRISGKKEGYNLRTQHQKPMTKTKKSFPKPSRMSENKEGYNLRTQRQKPRTKSNKFIQKPSRMSGIKKHYYLRTRRQKPMSKGKKLNKKLNEFNLSSSSKVLKYKKYNMKCLRQKCCRKNSSVNEINVFSSNKVSRCSSINECRLSVEKCGNSFKGLYSAFGKEYNFDKEVRVNLTRLDKEVRVNLTRLNLADYSFIPIPGNSLQNTIISSDVTSVKNCSVKIHQTYLNDNILTSTPITLQKSQEKNNHPNISGIHTFSNKDDCSDDLPLLSKPISHSTFILAPVNPAVFPKIEIPVLSPVQLQLLTKSRANPSVSHLSSSIHSSLQQISRPCKVRSKVDKLGLSGKSSIRSFCSKNEINATSHIEEKTIECTLSTLLQISQQDSVIIFQDMYDLSFRDTAVRKIGQGTYGEVFMITDRKKSSVLKVIPFKEDNDDLTFQTMESVFSEIKVSLCLSELRNNENNQTSNFNKLKRSFIVVGKYPTKIIFACCEFKKTYPLAYSRSDFNEEQLFAVLELEYGGEDMFNFEMRNAVEAESILKQIVISLAIAEEELLFEHRDLHLGNILVKRNNTNKICYIVQGKPFCIPNKGLVVSVIDFTLSRILDSGVVFFNDLADYNLTSNRSSFNVYKMTRQGLNNEWQKSHLFSNVLWISYLCIKFLEKVTKGTLEPSKKHLESVEGIKKIQKKLQDCKSAMDVLRNLKILDFVPESSQRGLLQSKTTYVNRKPL